MNSLLKPKPRKDENFSRAWKVVIVFVVVVIAITKILPNTFFTFFNPIAKPFWKFENNFFENIRNLPIFVTKRGLLEENQSLKEKVIELEMRSIDYDLVLNENQALKSEQNIETNLKPGRVIVRPTSSLFDIIIADFGNTNADVGRKIYGPGNLLLGEVVESMFGTAKIRLYSNPGLETNVTLKDGTSVVLKGRGNGNFLVSVPKDLPIEVGDYLTYDSINSNILARVYSIEEKDTESFKNIFSAYPLNIFDLRWVYLKQ